MSEVLQEKILHSHLSTELQHAFSSSFCVTVYFILLYFPLTVGILKARPKRSMAKRSWAC